ncbi:cell surface protein [Lactiplantibacillus daoliensis]|uniref:Cell surface protein n=1 Tax=Lactiplantibacillus daoliensis TaxID=2559916 RepID=A0ABW1UHT1_9LACO|nr:cell surface protein [Lactiplantibacillus daoliensis]
MRWNIGLTGLTTFMSGRPLIASADVQQGTYNVTIKPLNSSVTDSTGPLANLLPQMNEIQQWTLFGMGLLIVSLLGLLIKLWWQSRQQTKEQS